MPQIDNPNSPSAWVTGELRRIWAAIKDLANNPLQAPFSLTVGTGGFTDNGPATLLDGVTVTGGETVDTLTVTGNSAVQGTETVTGLAHLNGGANIAGATITSGAGVTGGLSTDTLTASGNATVAGTATVTGNVTSNGQVNSAGSPLMSQPSYGYVVTTSYKATWQDGVTYQFGYSPSTSEVKVGLTAMTAADAAKFVLLTPYWGRYVWDDPTSPLKVFFLAEDVQNAGFGADVAPIVETEPLEMLTPDGLPVIGNDGNPVIIPVGQAYSINYSQMVVPLLAICRAQEDRITTLERYVQELATKTGTTLS